MSLPHIKSCPGTLADGYNRYSPGCLRNLFNGRKVSHFLPYLPATESEDDASRFIENRKRISISGVQEKVSLLLDKNKLRLTEPGEQGSYILKPIPRDVKIPGQVPANEHLTMQIARQVYNIKTAANGLIFFKSGEAAYITKRFDIRDGNPKWAQEDFASLSAKTEQNAGKDYKYSGSYQNIAEGIKKYVPAYPVELEKFFRLVLFNYLFSNGDAHLKNFSLLETENGDSLLSPAYDLLNTRLHVNDTDFALEDGLFTDDYESGAFKTQGYVCLPDFQEFAARLGIQGKRLEKILQQFRTKQNKVYQLTQNSYLDISTKKIYLEYYEQRLLRLNQV